MRTFALHHGQPPLIAALLPVSVDGLMATATVALGDGRRNRWSAWLAFWTGVSASVLANVLAARPAEQSVVTRGREPADRSNRPGSWPRRFAPRTRRSARPNSPADSASPPPGYGRSTGPKFTPTPPRPIDNNKDLVLRGEVSP